MTPSDPVPESHWTPALEEMDHTGTSIYGPESFRDYLSRHGFDPREYRTAAEISVNTRRDLGATLRDNQTMVLRAGAAPEGTGTQFALVRTENGVEDFFIDEQQFEAAGHDLIDLTPGSDDHAALSQQASDMLLAYEMLPTYSESSYLHLAMAIGVLSRALALDVRSIGTAPVTFSTSFDFQFRAHTDIGRTISHNRGQVEVDCCFVSRQDGQRLVVVLEAKKGRSRALAKHKLYYPLMGLRANAPEPIAELVPVYLRADSTAGAIEYDIYECDPVSVDGEPPALADIGVRNHRRSRVEL